VTEDKSVGLKGWLSGPRRKGSKTEAESSAVFDKNRVAVLPLSNISPDPKDEYFADGLTEELISTMSGISGLKVIARTSVAGYKGSPKKISEIGRELDVGTVLEGSVRKVGDRLRISVQLIDSQTSEHLWAENYDRDLKDVFEIQSDISKTVAEALRVQLLSQEKLIIEKKPLVNSDAYVLYLEGRVLWNERTKEGVNRALSCFEQAVKIDPKFALAYSGLADCYNILGGYSWIHQREADPLAKGFATKALQLDERLAEAHASLGLSLIHSWNFRSAEKELRRSIELRPSYAQAYYWLALLLFFQRKYEEADLQDQAAFEIDPASLFTTTEMANVLAEHGRSKEALEQFKRAIHLNPHSAIIHQAKARAHVLFSQYSDAIKEAETAIELDKNPDAEVNLAWVYAVAGRKDEARSVLANIERQTGERDYSLGFLGAVNLEMGEADKGFRLLEKGFEAREDGVLYFGCSPEFKKYRSDPRWVQIEKRIAAITDS